MLEVCGWEVGRKLGASYWHVQVGEWAMDWLDIVIGRAGWIDFSNLPTRVRRCNSLYSFPSFALNTFFID